MATRDVSDVELQLAQSLGRAAHRAGADYLHARALPDGRGVFLFPMYGGNVRLGIGELHAKDLDDVWCYRASENKAGWLAAIGWDGEGEPEGWYRHPMTGRRRPDGTAASEVVRW